MLRRSPSVKADVLIRAVKVLNDNIGYPVSLNKIAHSLKSAGYKAYYESVSSLVYTLTLSMLYLQAEFMLLKGRERFGSQLKLYCADHGIGLRISSLLSLNAEVIKSALEEKVHMRSTSLLKGERQSSTIR